MLVLRNCRFIPFLTEGSGLTQGDVQVIDGKIAAIAPAGAAFPGDGEELDVQGATVMPWLIDIHMHLRFGV